MAETNSTEVEGISRDQLNDLIFFSAVGGACAFTPVPDSICLMAVRHMMSAAQLRHSNIKVELTQQGATAVGALARGAPMTCADVGWMVAYYGFCCCIVEQVFKKLCFCFTVKDAVENTTALLHEGWILAYALKQGHVTDANLQNNTEVWRVREAILQTCQAVDTSPIQKAIKVAFASVQSKEALRDAANSTVQALHLHGGKKSQTQALEAAIENTDHESRKELQGVTKQLADLLKANGPYLRKLEAAYDGNLTTLKAQNAKPSSSLLG